MLLDEERVQRSLARVCTSEGGTLGTAFFVLGSEVVALTCHHLVESTGQVFLDFGDGRLRTGTIANEDRFLDVDIAVIRCSDAPPVDVLPIVAEQVEVKSYWTKGYHYHGTNIIQPLPVAGNIIGTTEIEFTTPGGTVYRLSGVLLLRDDVIDAGLSGAPVLDPETGGVFALVNAKFARENSPLPAGFALPLWRAASRHPRLRQLFEANRATVPCYGRFMNYLGAKRICEQQRIVILDRLIKRKRFLAEMYCERPAERLVEKFFHSDSLILPIVGNAGVGKSMLMAEVARRTYDQALVFLLAHQLNERETDLSSAITSSLYKVAPELIGPQGDASLVVSALRSSGGHLVILFDGLNETPIALLGNFRSWLESSVDWIEQSRAKLIVSSRPEFWEVWKGVLPEDLIYRNGDHGRDKFRASGVQLYDFSREEAEKVKELYGLGEALSPGDIQHPLMARVYWELEASERLTTQVPTTRSDALRRFIDLKCENIARALAPGAIRSSVEAGLKRAARASLIEGGFEITSEEFEELFRDPPRMSIELLQEGLFTSTATGVRFAFDEIAEFLQGQIIGLEEIADWTSADNHRWHMTAGTVVYAILRLQNEGKDEEVTESLRLIASARIHKGWDALQYENVFALLLQQLRRPEAYAPQIEVILQQMDGESRYNDFFKLRRIVAGISLPLKLKFELLKPFLIREDSYDFEPHHWADLDRYVFRHTEYDEHTAAILADLIQGAPRATFEILIEWLSDSTTLREGKSNVSDAAAALLFYFRHLSLEGQCELLARSETENAYRQLLRLAVTEPREMLKICLKWIECDDSPLLSRAVHIASRIAGVPEVKELEDDLYHVLSSARSRLDAQTEITAKKGIARIEKYRDTVLDDLLSLFKEGNTEVSGYEIAEWIGTHFDAVVSTIEDILRSGLNVARSSEALLAVIQPNLGAKKEERLFSLFELGVDMGLLEQYKFCAAFEYALYSVNSESGRQRMYIMARKAVEVGPDARRYLIYFATYCFTGENEHRKALADALLELLVEHETDLSNQSLLIGKLIEICCANPYYLKYLLKISSHMQPETFHHQVLRSVFRHREYAKLLFEWLEVGAFISPFGPTQSFLDRVRSGEAPDEAVRSIVIERLRYNE